MRFYSSIFLIGIVLISCSIAEHGEAETAETAHQLRGFKYVSEKLITGTGIRKVIIQPGTLKIFFSENECFRAKDRDFWQLTLNLEVWDSSWDRLMHSEEQEWPEEPEHLQHDDTIRFFLSAGDEVLDFTHKNSQPSKTITLYPGLIPFDPETMTVLVDPMKCMEAELEINFIPYGDSDMVSLKPLSAEPGSILRYDRKKWRQEEYEVFSWNRMPNVLIFDTADYFEQDRLFKRLAFFVEKKEFRGRLVSDQEVKDLHAYNAHDYRAEDLAMFFQKAIEESFALGQEEEDLEKILVYNGIIRKSEGRYTHGKGSVLSISRSSSDVLRRHLLTHECFHGIFFSYPEYREACFDAWSNLNEDEKAYWKLMFNWVGYDIQDHYLVVNEFQAYLFQQEKQDVSAYFTYLMGSRLIRCYPDKKDWIVDFLNQDPESFENAFSILEKSLWEYTGFNGGKVIDIVY